MSRMGVPAFEPGDAVLLVDPQNDFCSGGSLPVPEGERVMPVLTAWAAEAARAGIPVFVSRDWHPLRTTHFREFGGAWPPHCVAGTPGAEFHPDLRLPEGVIVVSGGTGETEDGYSAFEARDVAGTHLADLLRQRGVRHLYVMGLATDYCVKASVLDARTEGLQVTVVPEGIRAVDLQPGDGERALDEMRAAGATIATTGPAIPT
jgi:nicotinamidase/pyrazinamidase